ncbi:hypothetical protein BCV69DRAFT_299309 [Microstroma glucosiphilum]|uniref:CCHC-type domain-containing protein n=1 Tax=Pseudomicrostroma glucosiphilum TaxID=1684307 RepID=A0A316U6G4_9BASI|nr:hypothetical protein BCV69DRAFT_299309 [Pseudomicrostroma glucosiphilum]PWN20836.1 hypothetical protein BCV69DRAFT_299309 [Pseudomicrostroma glucosiphilum]
MSGQPREGGQASANVPIESPDINAMSSVLQIYAAFAQQRPNLSHPELMELSKLQFEANEKRQSTSVTVQRRVNITQEGFEWPKEVRNAIDKLYKLTTKNWNAWIMDFEAIWEGIPQVRDLLFGDIDEDHPEYDYRIDHKLVSVLRHVAEKESTDNILHIINRRKWASGKELFDYMHEMLTKNEAVVASTVLLDLSRVRMTNNEVSKVIREISNITTRAALVGIDISVPQQITQLCTATSYTHVYKDVWHTLESVGSVVDYDAVCAALIRREDRHMNESQARGPRAAALSASAHPKNVTEKPAEARSSRVSTKEEAYLYGRRDPRRPDEPAKCYTCGKTGHIARNCPDAKKEESKTTESNRETAALTSEANTTTN